MTATRTSKYLGLFSVCGLLLFYLLSFFFKIGFYFDASYQNYQEWFPNFHLPAFLFFKFSFPALLAVWSLSFSLRLYAIAVNIAVSISLFLSFSLLTCYCFSQLQFEKAIQMVWLVVFIEVFKISYPSVVAIAKQYVRQINFTKTYSFGFFFLYIFLCLAMPDSFLPFYKFTMYNKMSKNDHLFLIRDKNNQLVPIQKYFQLNSKGISLLQQKTFSSNLASQNSSCPQSEHLWKVILSYNNRSLPFDSLFLLQSNFQINNGVITPHEQLVYAAKVE